ncbi:MAG: hypothetical protein ACTTH6_03015 [Candidatus Altimarinota bacterium]
MEKSVLSAKQQEINQMVSQTMKDKGYGDGEIGAFQSIVDNHLREISRDILSKKMNDNAMDIYKEMLQNILKTKQTLSDLITIVGTKKQEIIEQVRVETDSLIIDSLRKAVHWTVDFDKDNPSKSHPVIAFFMGGLDSILAMPEFVELAISNSDFRSQVFEALKNLSWEQVKNQLAQTLKDLTQGNPYEQGRASVDIILTITGIAGIAKAFGKLLIKGGGLAAKTGGQIIAESPGIAGQIGGKALEGSGKFIEGSGKFIEGGANIPTNIAKKAVNNPITRKVGSAISDSTVGKAVQSNLKKASDLKNTVGEEIAQGTGKVKNAVGRQKNKIQEHYAEKRVVNTQERIKDIDDYITQNNNAKKALETERISNLNHMSEGSSNLENINKKINYHKYEDISQQLKQLESEVPKKNATVEKLRQERISKLKEEQMALEKSRMKPEGNENLKYLEQEKAQLERNLKKLEQQNEQLTKKMDRLDNKNKNLGENKAKLEAEAKGAEAKGAEAKGAEAKGAEAKNPGKIREAWDKWRQNSAKKSNELKALREEKAEILKALQEEKKALRQSKKSPEITENIANLEKELNTVNSKITETVGALQTTLKQSALPAAAITTLITRINEKFDINDIDPNWEKEVFQSVEQKPNPKIPQTSKEGDGQAPNEGSTQFSETPTVNLDLTRKINGKIATTDYRESTSKRSIQTTQWKQVVREWNNIQGQYADYIDQEVKNIIRAAIHNPTPLAVKNLQELIGLESSDTAKGQDGMLGPNTITAFKHYLETIKQSASDKEQNEGQSGDEGSIVVKKESVPE